ncbi:DUF3078 domain-containing protein [Flammeovirga yaeyamensis]|uniref:DUF3078 domain-containing protein n=1 Tax=Flammeovirga yaeyamensis TaxID=367791 RepID=A0AAX1NBQ6_9BACT|nr:DUF3078 domain-containing protein [Flammeovirga yaeyamensis]MBB3698715.1 hypothetical protein [Flammeovirga yaeyamensis]NMF37301.1 DUF3078 domain-containing protein [Flammeovirga yaeyamensis]QWG03881.1 DUF3078 domain-containing protein [Flammeovirga yaeyamensis]
MKIQKVYFIFLLTITSFITSETFAQDSTATAPQGPWKKEGKIGANFSNVGLVNWTGGGTSSYSFGGVFNYKMIRETEKAITRISTDMAYGMINQSESAFPMKKTDDQLVLGFDYSYKWTEKLLFTVALDFRSQFDKGFEYNTIDDPNNPGGKIETETQISAFMAPGYLNANIGLTYTPAKWIYATYSPVANRMTFVVDTVFSTRYGLDTGDNFRDQLGMNFKLGIKKELVKNVTLTSTYNMFAEYDRLDEWVVNWDLLIDMKVNDWLSANFGTQLIYDPDVTVNRDDGTMGQAIQFKHALNIGIVYTLHKKKEKKE